MIVFYLKEALKSLSRQKGSALITIFTLVISILITSTAFVSIYLSKAYSNSLISSIKVNLFLENSLTKNDKTEIFSYLKSNKLIKSFILIDKDEAKSEFVKETGEDFSSFLEINPLPESIRLSLKAEKINIKEIENIVNQFRNIKGVNDVVYDYEYLIKIIDFFDSVQIFLYVFSFVSVLISIYLIFSTNKLIYNSRVETYNIMKLVGAKLFAIKTPIYLSSLLLGLTASTICIILLFFLLLGLTNIINNVNFTKWIIMISTIIPSLGVIFGILGGIFSTKNINLKIERG